MYKVLNYLNYITGSIIIFFMSFVCYIGLIKIYAINTSRMGPLAGFTINHLKNLDESKKTILIPLIDRRNSNVFANEFLREKLKMNNISFLKLKIDKRVINFINKIFNKNIIITYNIFKEKQKPKKINFFFNNEENLRGENALEKFGIKSGEKFACIHNRDSMYLKKFHSYNNWSYHDYRDFSIETFKPTIKYLINKGYKVIRVGKAANEFLKFPDPNYIDYVNSNLRNDFNDIFLLSKCDFYLGSDSGIYSIANSFEKKISFVNFPSISLLSLYHSDKNLPCSIKLIKNRKDNKLLTFEEMLRYKFDNLLNYEELYRSGYELISNTDQEIKELAMEILGDYQINEMEKKYLTDKFSLIFNRYNHNTSNIQSVPRIGISFLKKYKYLLD